jgi:hypothetical protein
MGGGGAAGGGTAGAPPPTQVCGNGIVEGTEKCDGAALNNQSCATQGSYVGGTLKCDPGCMFFDVSECLQMDAGTTDGG